MSELLRRSSHQRSVDEFMRLAGQELPARPVLPDEKVRWLRARLILEEAFETVEALGFRPVGSSWCQEGCRQVIVNRGDNLRLNFGPAEPNLVEIADGCADIKVVTTGTLSACGIPDHVLQELVDENNLGKIKGSTRDQFGKLVKPVGYPKPKIAELLDRISEEPQ